MQKEEKKEREREIHPLEILALQHRKDEHSHNITLNADKHFF